jgi:hypothetical protein
MSAKHIIILVLFVGLSLIVYDLTKTYYQCPAPKVVYKFLPRSMEENLENPVPLDDVFKSMFEAPSPWIASFGTDMKKIRVGDMFVSQA